jgi:hypothetical protein
VGDRDADRFELGTGGLVARFLYPSEVNLKVGRANAGDVRRVHPGFKGRRQEWRAGRRASLGE